MEYVLLSIHMPLLFPAWAPETGNEYSMLCKNDFFWLVYTRAEKRIQECVLYSVGRLSYPVTIATDKQMRLVIAKSLHVQTHRYKSTLWTNFVTRVWLTGLYLTRWQTDRSFILVTTHQLYLGGGSDLASCSLLSLENKHPMTNRTTYASPLYVYEPPPVNSSYVRTVRQPQEEHPVGVSWHSDGKNVYLTHTIRESVDSLCRDGADAQYMQYLSKSRITSPLSARLAR